MTRAVSRGPAIYDAALVDRSIDLLLKNFCETLRVECLESKRDVAEFVDFYGLEKKGFMSFQEFRDLYYAHVEAEAKAPSLAKLKALFGLFDAFGIGKVKKEDFAKIVATGRPLNTI